MLGVAKVDERIKARYGLEDDIAALATVAAVGAAELNELLTPEAHCAGTAGTGTDEDLGLVEEMHAAAGYAMRAGSESLAAALGEQ